MSTRSRIGMVMETGHISSVYCHSDGYLEGPHGVGHVLHTYFQDPTKISTLLEFGDRGSLVPTEPKFGRIYGGDKAASSATEEDFLELSEEFTYLYDGQWWVWDHERPKTKLTLALITERLLE